jgi:hypothetical protein
MEPADETAMTEIMIHPDGRIFVFGLSREVGEILVSLCPEKHPLIESMTDSDAPAQQGPNDATPSSA